MELDEPKHRGDQNWGYFELAILLVLFVIVFGIVFMLVKHSPF